MQLAGISVDPRIQMLAAAVDRLGLLVWAQTKDAQKGRNRPKSLLDELTKAPDRQVVAFDTAEEFNVYRNRIIKEGVTDGHGAG